MTNISSTTTNKLTFTYDGVDYIARVVKLSKVSIENNTFYLDLATPNGAWNMGLFQINLDTEPELGEVVMDMIASNFTVENVVEAEGKIALFLEYSHGKIAGITSADNYFYKVPVLRSLFQVAL
jgi:hypothetical protein